MNETTIDYSLLVQEMKNSLEPFDHTKTSPYREWFSYFGIDSRPVSLGTFTAGPFELAAYYTAPVDPVGTIIFIPGFLDHSAVHKKLINFLLDQNYAVLAADLPGHGFSSGDRGTISDFKLYGTMVETLVELAKQQQLPSTIHCMGHSTGCAAILELLRTKGKTWNGKTIYIAPLIRSPLWRLSTAGTALAQRSNILTTPRIFQRTSHDTSFLAFLKSEPHQIRTFVVEWSESLAKWVPLVESASFPPIDLTVIQGTDDFTVGWRTNMKTIRRLFPCAEIQIIPGGKHHLLNETEPFAAPVYTTIAAVLKGSNRDR